MIDSKDLTSLLLGVGAVSVIPHESSRLPQLHTVLSVPKEPQYGPKVARLSVSPAANMTK